MTTAQRTLSSIITPSSPSTTPLISAPLLESVENGDIDSVRDHINAGEDLEVCNQHGETPLMIAARFGHYEIFKLLHRAHADLHKTNIHNQNASMLAVRFGHFNILEYITNVHPIVNNQLLLIAASKGYYDITEMLISKGANPNPDSTFEQLPLTKAVINGHLEIIVLLHQNGAELDRTDAFGTTALHAAAIQGKLSSLRTLHERGANIEFLDTHGYSPLMSAAENGHIEVVKQLLNAGADYKICTESPQLSAIHLAAKNFHLDVMRELVAAGESLTSKHDHGECALFYALEGGNFKFIERIYNFHHRSGLAIKMDYNFYQKLISMDITLGYSGDLIQLILKNESLLDRWDYNSAASISSFLIRNFDLHDSKYRLTESILSREQLYDYLDTVEMFDGFNAGNSIDCFARIRGTVIAFILDNPQLINRDIASKIREIACIRRTQLPEPSYFESATDFLYGLIGCQSESYQEKLARIPLLSDFEIYTWAGGAKSIALKPISSTLTSVESTSLSR